MLNLSLVSIMSVSSYSEGYANQVTLCEKMPHHQLILGRSSSLLETTNALHTQTANFKELLKVALCTNDKGLNITSA